MEGTRLAPLGAGLVLGTVLFTAWTLHGMAPPPLPPSGGVVLAPGQEAMTQWVEVPVGEEARWQWHSESYINFEVDARGVGALNGDDAFGGQGCARAVAPSAVRVWWGNTAEFGGGEAAAVNYSIVVQPGEASCGEVPATNAAWYASLGWQFTDFGSPRSWLLPGLAGNVAFAGLVMATRWPTRHERRAARQARLIEREWREQERARWVEEQVRMRQGRAP